MAPAAPNADRELTVTRVLDAPRELVFKAFTAPEHLDRWWGPKDFTSTTHHMDFRPGGVWRYVMRGPDGHAYQNRIVFQEIVPPERIVYLHDDGGEEHIEKACFHHHLQLTEEAGQPGRTRVTLRMRFPTRAELERIANQYGAVEGALGHLACLAEMVTAQSGGKLEALTLARVGAEQLILRRTFAAPRQRVFVAMTQVEHLRQWWGPRALTNIECSADFRPGGSWRIVLRSPDGTVHPFCGEYLEIAAPQRVVQTFKYDVEGFRDQVSTETMTLEEVAGRTVLTVVSVGGDCAQSKEMEAGAAECYDRLEELLAAPA